MGADWYPKAIRDPGNSGGSFVDNGSRKGLFHSTEGKNYAGARGAFQSNNSWPHNTATIERGFFEIYQHNPYSTSSRSLQNLAGGSETNREPVFQLEIVGTCDPRNASWGQLYVANWPKMLLDGVAEWMRWMEANHGIPRRCSVQFKPYPASAGSNNGVRLNNRADWDNYSGWLCHENAIENVHGDCGDFTQHMAYLLGQQTHPEDEDMKPSLAVNKAGYVYLLILNQPMHGKEHVPNPARLKDIIGLDAFLAHSTLLSQDVATLSEEYLALYKDVGPEVSDASITFRTEDIAAIAKEVAALATFTPEEIDQLVKAFGAALASG